MQFLVGNCLLLGDSLAPSGILLGRKPPSHYHPLLYAELFGLPAEIELVQSVMMPFIAVLYPNFEFFGVFFPN